MSNLKILIVEDHALTRFALKTAFEDDTPNTIIFEAENAQKGFDILEKENIDIIIMDLGLPDIDGVEATRQIKAKFPSKKVIILSSHEKEEDVIKSIKAGASAYCTKDISPEKLIDIVNSVSSGAAWFDPKIAQFVLNAAAQKDSNENDLKQESLDLTAREKQVLKLITEGYTNNEIAQKLDISINTTKVHVCSLLQKLGVQDRTQAAIKAIKDELI